MTAFYLVTTGRRHFFWTGRNKNFFSDSQITKQKVKSLKVSNSSHVKYVATPAWESILSFINNVNQIYEISSCSKSSLRPSSSFKWFECHVTINRRYPWMNSKHSLTLSLLPRVDRLNAGSEHSTTYNKFVYGEERWSKFSLVE